MGKAAIVHMLQRTRDISSLLESDDEADSAEAALDTMLVRVAKEQSRIRPRARTAPKRLDYTKEMQRSKTLVEPETPPTPKVEVEHSDQFDSELSDGVEELDEVVEVDEDEPPAPAPPVARASWRRPRASTLPPKKRTPSRTPSPEPASAPAPVRSESYRSHMEEQARQRREREELEEREARAKRARRSTCPTCCRGHICDRPPLRGHCACCVAEKCRRARLDV